MYHPTVDTAGKRWYPAPHEGSRWITSAVIGVYLHADEEVDWHVAYNPDGSQTINGYTIKKKGQYKIPARCLDPEHYVLDLDIRKLI